MIGLLLISISVNDFGQEKNGTSFFVLKQHRSWNKKLHRYFKFLPGTCLVIFIVVGSVYEAGS